MNSVLKSRSVLRAQEGTANETIWRGVKQPSQHRLHSTAYQKWIINHFHGVIVINNEMFIPLKGFNYLIIWSTMKLTLLAYLKHVTTTRIKIRKKFLISQIPLCQLFVGKPYFTPNLSVNTVLFSTPYFETFLEWNIKEIIHYISCNLAVFLY